MWRSVDNLIWIEHRDRELDYARELAAALRTDGLGESLILSMPFFLPLGLFLAPKRVFVPFLKSLRDAQLRILRRRGGRAPLVVSLNFEQLLGHFNRGAKRPDAPGAVHGYWYDQFEEVLTSWSVPRTSWVRLPPPESLLVSRRAYEQRLHAENGGRPPFERIVFIPENYSWAFANEETLRKKVSAGFDAEHIDRLRRYSIDSLAVFCRQLHEAAAEWPNVLFIVRPHPSVDVASYQREIVRVAPLPPNVLVSKALSAWDWLGGCDGVLSSWSTVTYSARQLGLPAALHLPLPLIAELDVPWVRAMPRFEALSNAVKYVLQQPLEVNRTASRARFDQLTARLRTGVDVAPMTESASLADRLGIFLRACAASSVRIAGLVLPGTRARILRVYRHDFVAPLHVR